MGLKGDLSELASSLGADLFKVASTDTLNNAPEGHCPRDILPTAKSVIVLGMKLLDAQVDILPTGQEGDFFTASPRQDVYAGHDDFVSGQLDEIGFALARFLERRGFKAYHQLASRGGVDRRYWMGLFSLKHAAIKAGLGVFGYHSLVITPQYGPRLRLTAIVTDAEMEADAPLNRNFCEDCSGHPCITLCPANAIGNPENGSLYKIDKFACGQYLDTRPACAICLKVCPIGKIPHKYNVER